jgi:hypothetical protein
MFAGETTMVSGFCHTHTAVIDTSQQGPQQFSVAQGPGEAA